MYPYDLVMARGQNGVRRLASLAKQSSGICSACLHHLRAASTAASPIEIAAVEPGPSGQASSALTNSHSPSTTYKIKASVLISRPPILTRELTPFEKSYFLYQRRLNERLALPFTRYFYYQKGTPGDTEWKRKVKERKTPARDIGGYNGYGDEAWNDELLLGDHDSEPEDQIEKIVKDAEVEVKERDVQGDGEIVRKEQVERPMPRITEADHNGDFKSLDRRLERSLYLVVKNGKGRWEFPSSTLEKRESLHTAAERIIVQAGGPNMNTWVVGNMPIGHQVYNYCQAVVDKDMETATLGEKIFFMKARIMGGQANLNDNQFGLSDFQWLDREEIQRVFQPRDWNATKNLLPER